MLEQTRFQDFRDPRRFRDWSRREWADRSKYIKKGHQVIIQGVISGKVSKQDTINVDLWYDSAYELYTAGWNLKAMAKMSDVFHKHVSVVFQPRALFRNGKHWPPQMKGTQCTMDGKYCFDMGTDYERVKTMGSRDGDQADVSVRGQME